VTRTAPAAPGVPLDRTRRYASARPDAAGGESMAGPRKMSEVVLSASGGASPPPTPSPSPERRQHRRHSAGCAGADVPPRDEPLATPKASEAADPAKGESSGEPEVVPEAIGGARGASEEERPASRKGLEDTRSTTAPQEPGWSERRAAEADRSASTRAARISPQLGDEDSDVAQSVGPVPGPAPQLHPRAISSGRKNVVMRALDREFELSAEPAIHGPRASPPRVALGQMRQRCSSGAEPSAILMRRPGAGGAVLMGVPAIAGGSIVGGRFPAAPTCMDPITPEALLELSGLSEAAAPPQMADVAGARDPVAGPAALPVDGAPDLFAPWLEQHSDVVTSRDVRAI